MSNMVEVDLYLREKSAQQFGYVERRRFGSLPRQGEFIMIYKRPSGGCLARVVALVHEEPQLQTTLFAVEEECFENGDEGDQALHLLAERQGQR